MVDKADTQGNVLAAYPHHSAAYVSARIMDPEDGRSFLREIGRQLTTAASWTEPPAVTWNVALSFKGLQALGVDARALAPFPAEFKAGMAARAEQLGDVATAAPATWRNGLRAGEVDLLVTVYGRDDTALADALGKLDDLWPAGVRPAEPLLAAVIEHGSDALVREHFGFADGFSQPDIDDPDAGPYRKPGSGTPTGKKNWRPVAPGEFVLGLRDEDGVVAGEELGALGQNGSFMVLRRLEQDVAAFRDYLAAHADERGPDWLAARMMGRWYDGTPLALSPDAPDPVLVAEPRGLHLNDFRYADDPGGFRCPIGAHVRRANPRDALGWEGQLSRRHRIIRRGMPYGPPLAEGAPADGVERGLMFVCYQASIARQFEVIQSRWIADGDAYGLGDDQDPIIGAGVKLTVNGDPPLVLPLRQFVTLRGGEYLFVPGLRALAALAQSTAAAA